MYKNLILNRDKIRTAIELFCNCNYKDFNITEEEKPYFHRYNIDFDGNSMFLDLFFKKDGTTTIQTSNGKNIDEKEKLAAYIMESGICNMTSGNNHNRSLLFKNVSIDDFEAIMRMIPHEDCFSAIIKRNDNENSIIVQLEGVWSDKITVTYFKSTQNVRLQGKPLAIFSTVSSLFNELIDIDNIVETLDNSYMMDISKESIEEQYIALLPKSHAKHSEKLKKSLLKAVYNLNLPQQEYTCTELAFEALRALEGHIKLTLTSVFGIGPTSPYGHLSMFKYDDDTHTVSIVQPNESKISDPQKIEYYKKAYKYYREYRHKLFHWDFPENILMDGTEQIDDVEDVKNIIRDTLKIIDEFY